jgi:leucyl aminopeptidase
MERLPMQVRVIHDTPAEVRTRALVVPIFANGAMSAAVQALDRALNGALSSILASGEMKGKLAEVTLLHAPAHSFERILAVGLGEQSSFEPHYLARYAGAAVRYLGRRNLREIALLLPQQTQADPRLMASFASEGAITGSFDTCTYQSEPEKQTAMTSVSILSHEFERQAIEAGVARGTIVGEAVNFARRLALTPANDMTPTILADEAARAAKAWGLECECLDEARARAEGMGSFLSVAQGSAQPPAFIIMRYRGDPSSSGCLALLGKGITFDTGGISLKPPERMEEMKYDMSGGAAVIATMAAVGRLQPKLNIIGLVPATENMPGGKATKPGDIVTAMNGKTIEIINTDAEGRLVLADALCYAAKLGATQIVDAATLTGACVIALGHAASAAVGNDQAFMKRFLDAAQPSGERYWQMPAYDDYAAAMKSDIADLKNTGGRPAGTLTAAAFLKAFVGETPWIHLDIAGTAYLENESAWQAKGPTGTPVRAFIALIESLVHA